MLIHLCGGKTWSSDCSDKGGHEAGGGGQTWVSGPPALLHVLPPRTMKDLGLQSCTVFPLHCPGAPSPLLGCLTQTAGPLGGRGAQGGGPPLSHAPPPHRAHCLWTQGTKSGRCSPFTGTSLHGEACARGVQPPARASSEWGPHFLPKDTRVCGRALNHRYRLRPWCFIQTPEISPYFYRERRSLL